MPPLTNLIMLVGDELGQVCLDPFSLQLKFERCALTLEHEIEHIDTEGKSTIYTCVASEGPALSLHRLLQLAVVDVKREELSFTLHFIDGQSLVVRTELGAYECGQIYSSDRNVPFMVF